MKLSEHINLDKLDSKFNSWIEKIRRYLEYNVNEDEFWQELPPYIRGLLANHGLIDWNDFEQDIMKQLYEIEHKRFGKYIAQDIHLDDSFDDPTLYIKYIKK